VVGAACDNGLANSTTVVFDCARLSDGRDTGGEKTFASSAIPIF
jgi:hypothetical protein